MNPGELRHRITYQRTSQEQNTFGQPIEVVTDIMTISASIKPIVGKEYFAADTINSEVTHKIKHRYIPNITPDLKIKFGTRTFNIISVINFEERNVELQIMCKEVV